MNPSSCKRQPTVIDQLQEWWDQDRRIHQIPPAWQAHRALAGATPAELLDCVRPGRPILAEKGEAIMAALVQLAADDDLAALTGVMMLLPAAKGLMWRTRGSGRYLGSLVQGDVHDSEERAAVVVSLLFEKVRTYPHWRRHGTVVGNITADILKGMLRAQGLAARQEPVPVADYRYIQGRSGGRHERHGGDESQRHVWSLASSGGGSGIELLELLVEAVQDGVLTAADARLIAELRCGERSATELAAHRGLRPQTIRKQRQRAERTLKGSFAAAA